MSLKVLFLPRTLGDATAYYRCVLPARALNEAGCETRLEPLFATGVPKISGESVEWADVVVLQRPLSVVDVELVEQIKTRHPGKVLVGEYDDDYGTVPGWNPGYRFVLPCQNEWPQVVPLFDGVTVSTEPLAGAMRRHTDKPVTVIRNSFDFDLIDSLEPKWDAPIQTLIPEGLENFPIATSQTLRDFSSTMQGKTVVTWFGSHTHYVDLDWLVEDVRDLYAVHNRQDVVFVFFGYVLWKFLAEIPAGNCFFIPGQAPEKGSDRHGVEEFYRVLKALPASVGLAPVHPCVFNDSKSSLKVEECKIFGFLPVASRYDTYMNDIDEGLLADYGYGHWSARIREAIDCPSRAARLLRNGELVRQKHGHLSRASSYLSFYEALLEMKGA